ncbi:MAG: hypothetical protein ACXACY_29590 [Candidatus Hodarchaeales archaeon]|jgi:hypothetical protein
MKKEWHEIIHVPPAVLYKSDVIELVRIITECESAQSYELLVTYGYEGLHQTISTIEDLEKFSKDIPTNKLSIDSTIKDEKKNNVGVISITMYHNFIHYYIYSANEAWYLGKIAQLTSFFKSRKPWYSLINRILPIVSPALVMSGFLIGLFALKNANIILAIISLFLAFIMLIISYYAFNYKLFPYVRIYATNKEKRVIPYEIVLIVIALLTLIVMVIGLFLQYKKA